MKDWLKYFLAALGALAIILATACGSVAANTPPRVKSAILYNMDSGQILYERNGNMPIAPASLTKIMTMFLVLDSVRSKKISLNQKIRISRQAANTGGSAMHLKEGERVPVVRLLAGMAVASGNDAANALALHLGGTEKNFAAMMNAKARKLGMLHSNFRNATGLPSAGQKTTARDLLLLCRAYLRTHPEAMRFHKMLFLMHKGAVARNTNPLLGSVPGVDGLKTGWTVASGYNLIVTAKRKSTRLLAIVLGASSKEARSSMARKLIEAGFRYPRDPILARRFINSQ